MKMMTSKSTSEIMSLTPTKTMDFGIKDPLLIIEYMSKTIYSNPLRIMCQEILTNARDANIEAGRGSEPIQVQIPTPLDNNLIITDHGIGINPDRIENIFIQYGSSTKRHTNNQSGGFGIGAKTPFAYTTSFMINTICRDVDGVKRKYIYSLFKESTGICPKAILVSVNETNEKLGTSISIPIEIKDLRLIIEEISDITFMWKVIPKILNVDDMYARNQQAFDGLKIAIQTPQFMIYSSSSYQTPNCRIFVDEIPYSMDYNMFKSIFNLPNGYTAYIFFKTGDIELALSRETIQFSEKTNGTLQKLSKEINDSLCGHIQNIFDACETFFDASVLFDKFNVLITSVMPQGLMWKDLRLNSRTSFHPMIEMLPYEIKGHRNPVHGRATRKVSILPSSDIYVNNTGTKSILPYVRGFFNSPNASSLLLEAVPKDKEILGHPYFREIISFCENFKSISEINPVIPVKNKNRSTLTTKEYWHNVSSMGSSFQNNVINLQQLKNIQPDKKIYIIQMNKYSRKFPHQLEFIKSWVGEEFQPIYFIHGIQLIKSMIKEIENEYGLTVVHMSETDFYDKIKDMLLLKYDGELEDTMKWLYPLDDSLCVAKNLINQLIKPCVDLMTDDMININPSRQFIWSLMKSMSDIIMLSPSINISKTKLHIHFLQSYDPNFNNKLERHKAVFRTFLNSLNNLIDIYNSYTQYKQHILHFSDTPTHQYIITNSDRMDIFMSFADDHKSFIKEIQKQYPQSLWDKFMNLY